MAGGGGGIVPVTFVFWLTMVSGVSVTFVAEIFIPGLRPQASTICPSTSNFWSFGILNSWFVPSSSVRIRERGGVTWNTFPVTVSTFVTIVRGWWS